MTFKLPPGGITTSAFLGTGCFLIVITFFFVFIRLFNSIGYAKRLFADDYLAVLAWVINAVNFGMYCQLITILTGTSTSIPAIARFIIAESWVGGFAIYFAKLPILVLFLRLFEIRRRMIFAVWTTILISFGVFTAGLIYTTVECSASKVVDVPTLELCLAVTPRSGLAHGICSLAVDTIIFVLPLPIILQLNLTLKKKVGLAIVFSAGIFAIIASSVSLNYKVRIFNGSPDPNNGTAALICTNIECSVAIIVGCVPAIRSFWSNQFIKSAIYSRIQSLFSYYTTRTPAGPSPPSSPKEFERKSASSTEQFVDGGGQFVELREGKFSTRADDREVRDVGDVV